jgi:PAS domain-containing protein
MPWRTAASIVIDAAGRYVDANESALDLLGVASVEVLRDTPPDTFTATPSDPAEREAFAKAYAESAATGLLIEAPIRRLDGELVRTRTAVVPEPEGGYRVLLQTIQRPTDDLSYRVYTITDILSEWRSAERRMVELDPSSDEAATVAEQIDLFKTQYQRMFHRSIGRAG